MKTTQGIFIGLVLIVIIVIIGLFSVFLSLDSLVATAIEKHGSQVTQTNVKVSSVNISLKEGQGAVNGLRIANPPKFSSNNAFSFKSITMKIDVSTLRKNPLVIDEVFIRAPHAVYEINDAGASNIDILKQNVYQYQRQQGRSKKDSVEKTAEDRKMNLVIRKLLMENGNIDIKIAAFNEKKLSAKLPRIQLTNIGQEKGISHGEVAEQVLAALVKNVGPAVARLNIEQYLDKGVEEVGKKAQQKVDEKISESFDAVTRGAGDSVKKLLGN